MTRDPRETWPTWDGPTLQNQPKGTRVRLDHHWLAEGEVVTVTGKMRPGRRRVVERDEGGTLALPWETPVLEVEA